MPQHIAQLALLVDEYDRAIAWYTTALQFELIEDTPLCDSKRWVVIAPRGSSGSRILLEANPGVVSREELQEICDRYASQTVVEELKRAGYL